MQDRLRIVVSGLIGQYPLGGVTWDYLQYALGFARLGHDVYYLEDTGQWPFNPEEGGVAKGPEYTVRYLARVMERFGFADRWAYRFPWDSQWFGMTDGCREEVIGSADLILNVSGTLQRPWDYRAAKRLAYLDSDPVFTQVKLAKGQHDFRQMVDAHDVHFTFGERPSDEVPVTGHTWLPTRQPIVLDEWTHTETPRDVFTTVMNWTSYKALTYDGRSFGQKDEEFQKFMGLPSRVAPANLEIAVNAGKTRRTPRELLAHKGWRVVDPNVVCPDLDSYRLYLQRSKGEWSVAKNGYVIGRSGWFSCRSACYLASGRPVVVQDTGFSDILPTGEGLFAFTDEEEAAEAIAAVEADYSRHTRVARDIAEGFFRAEAVLSKLLGEVGL